MTTFAHPHWFAAAALFLISSVERAAATKYSFQLGYTAVLVARVGPGWTDTSSFHSGTLKTIRLVREQPPGSRRAKVLLTPLLPIQEGSRLGSSEQIRKAIQERANSMGSNALERELKVEERSAGENRLVYFSATDPKPKPGEYLRMPEGRATFGDVPSSMIVLHDD